LLRRNRTTSEAVWARVRRAAALDARRFAGQKSYLGCGAAQVDRPIGFLDSIDRSRDGCLTGRRYTYRTECLFGRGRFELDVREQDAEQRGLLIRNLRDDDSNQRSDRRFQSVDLVSRERQGLAALLQGQLRLAGNTGRRVVDAHSGTLEIVL